MPDLTDLLDAEAHRLMPASVPAFATIERRTRLRRRHRLTTAAAVLAVVGSGVWVAATRQVGQATLSVVAQDPTPTATSTGAPQYDGHLTGEQAVEVFDGRTLEEAVRRAHALGIAVQAYDPRLNRMLAQEPNPGLVLLVDRERVAWVSGTRSPLDRHFERPNADEAHRLIGMTSRDAVREVTDRDWTARVIRVDGLGLASTADLVPFRLNLSLAGGFVTAATLG